MGLRGKEKAQEVLDDDLQEVETDSNEGRLTRLEALIIQLIREIKRGR
jgi:hypothetical protein